MKVALLTGLRKLEIGRSPAPKLQRPDSVLVRIDRVGVCGSDVHYYVHGGIGAQRVAYPATVGHECAGTILELGRGVTALKVGQRVAIDPAETRFQYTVGAKTQDTLAASDLDNLRFVNVSLRLVRTAAVPGGRRITITGSAVERITPLSLKRF